MYVVQVAPVRSRYLKILMVAFFVAGWTATGSAPAIAALFPALAYIAPNRSPLRKTPRMPVTTLKLLLECREIVSRPVKGGTANSGKSAENGPKVVFFN